MSARCTKPANRGEITLIFQHHQNNKKIICIYKKNRTFSYVAYARPTKNVYIEKRRKQNALGNERNEPIYSLVIVYNIYQFQKQIKFSSEALQLYFEVFGHGWLKMCCERWPFRRKPVSTDGKPAEVAVVWQALRRSTFLNLRTIFTGCEQAYMSMTIAVWMKSEHR